MELQYQITKEQLMVPMPKEVDHHIAKTISREIDFLIDSWHVRKLIFDFAETDFMDSSGIGVLIGRKRPWICTGEKSVQEILENVHRKYLINQAWRRLFRWKPAERGNSYGRTESYAGDV